MTEVPADRVPEHLIDAMIARLREGSTAIPTAVGKYRITGVVGEGGMGRVLLAYDGERRVAIKTLGAGWQGSAEALYRFEREARCMAALQHPGICRVLDWVTVDTSPYLVLEYVEGETLAQKLHDGVAHRGNPVSAETWVQWVEMAARALHAAHGQGMVHRDVKPGNIMVRPDGSVVLMDFGVAWNAQAPMQDLTGSRLGVGTRPYMAPEQVMPHRWPDARTDVWALGVTLFELLQQVRPFQASTAHDLAEQILHAAVPKVRSQGRLSRRDLDSVLATAMAKEPAQRYRSALDFAQDLERLRRGAPVLARPLGLAERVLLLAKRRPHLLVGCMALAVVIAGSVAWYEHIVQARNASSDRRWQARCWELREETERQSAAYDALWPDSPTKMAATAGAIRAWLEGAARALQGMADSLEQDLRLMAPDLARLAQEEIAATRAFERQEMASALERARWWEVAERTANEDRDGLWAAALAANRGSLGKPQLGLQPLGPDPATGLWEFAHLRSGAPPRRDVLTGKLAITRESGLVFVLVRGGDFEMGAEVVPVAGAGRARLDPFFLSKYEMSRDQWARLARQWPQRLREETRNKEWSDPCASRIIASPFGADAVLPVFHVGWRVCEDLLHRDGLQLPTEAQWEMAARAGGDAHKLFDKEAANFRGCCSWRDNEDGPMPIDSLLPNAFGFHHMAGNVWEWCRDSTDATLRIGMLLDGDGLQVDAAERRAGYRTDRGGAYDQDYVHVSQRNVGDSRCVWHNEGVRPVRAVDR